MFYNYGMDDITRLKMLSQQMHLEPAENCSVTSGTSLDDIMEHGDDVFIHPAILPNGQRIKLLKTLLTSACERDCNYCPFRAGRDFRRASFHPEDFARLFLQLVENCLAEGIFLSSGVAGGGIRTQDKLIATAEILRFKMGFNGYIHLKIMPGAERAQVERAMQLADRLSVNLEAPNRARLAHLAPHKSFVEELLTPLKWVDEIRTTQSPAKAWKGRWPSTVTQFVAGGAGESDLELLATTDWLHRNVHLKRAYYSRFNPVANTPLENQPPTPPLREHRLYQASFLLRDYGFDLEELPFESDGNLPLPIDPKRAWAENKLRAHPIEVNRASQQELLRIPGIGPKGAEKIVHARQREKVRDISALRSMGIQISRAAPYLLLDGRRTDCQLALF